MLKKFTPSLQHVFIMVLGSGFCIGAQDSRQSEFRNYIFSQDFSIKPSTRDITHNIFWRYPTGPLPTLRFPIYSQLDDEKIEVPVTFGEGADIEALNLGRKALLSGNNTEAISVWNKLKSKRGNTFSYHRRLDYFLALAHLSQPKPRPQTLNLAADHLAQALIHKKDTFDPIFDNVSAKQYYNLGILFLQLNRKAEAERSLEAGLRFLRHQGKSDYRPHILRTLAELKIQNEDYEEAVQYFRRAFLLDLSQVLASEIIARMGDIFFNLNHFELAAQNYATANTIDVQLNAINPHQHVLYGESLFWLSRFQDAIRHFRYGLDASSQSNIKHPLPESFAALAALRTADAFLALNQYPQARIAYDSYLRKFPKDPNTSVAQVRLACLELPAFEGENLPHARKLLSSLQKEHPLGSPVHELAHACEVISFSQRERTVSMIDRVKSFLSQYPSSHFLTEFIEPVRETQAGHLSEMFDNPHLATQYFEANRDKLFKNTSPDIRQKLFFAYIDIHKSAKAKEFWDDVKNRSLTEAQLMKTLLFLEETRSTDPKRKALILVASKRKWTLSFNDEHLILRFLQTSRIQDHLEWMYHRASAIYRSNRVEVCHRIYPLIAAMNPASNLRKTALAQEIDAHFPSILTSHESCGVSILDLELFSSESAIEKLATSYLNSRADWPMSKALATLMWEIAERCAKAGYQKEAESLWRAIIDKAPQGTPERSFSRIRLQKDRTELEDLWR